MGGDFARVRRVRRVAARVIFSWHVATIRGESAKISGV
jgi:hypothetical protein